MKYIYYIIGGLLLCVHSMYAQVAPNKTKTEIVMTVDELQYLLEQIGRAELTNLRDKELDSMLSAVKYKQKEMPYTSTARVTWGPCPNTISAPASITECANL